MAYSIERKEAILKKLLPPINQTVAEVARAEGLSVNTLYNWRDKARQSGLPVPGKTPTSNDWSADTKLATVVETMALSESELSQYCREKGLYVDQIMSWKSQCLNGFALSQAQQKEAAKRHPSCQPKVVYTFWRGNKFRQYKAMPHQRWLFKNKGVISQLSDEL